MENKIDQMSARSQASAVSHLAEFSIYYEYLGNESLTLFDNKYINQLFEGIRVIGLIFLPQPVCLINAFVKNSV